MQFTYTNKSTPEEIRKKFNQLVDSYSDLEAGQKTAIDSILIAGLIAEVIYKTNPDASEILDIGCGAGNYSLRIASFLAQANYTLIDLSENMLEKAGERLKLAVTGKVIKIRQDIRDLEPRDNYYDSVVAGTTLHHLREEKEWYNVFKNIYRSLKKGGSFWISDVIIHDTQSINDVIWNRYDEFLMSKLGNEMREWVYEQMTIEDTPRSINFQTEVLREAGFKTIEILHKNANFAAFGGIK